MTKGRSSHCRQLLGVICDAADDGTTTLLILRSMSAAWSDAWLITLHSSYDDFFMVAGFYKTKTAVKIL